jgi:transposase
LQNYTLTPDQLAELKREHKLCKKRKEADRIKAVYLLGKGWTVFEVAEALLLEDDAIRRYFNCYQEGGLKNLLENKYVGRMSYLTETELALLETHLKEHTYQSVTEIIDYVIEEFDVEYTESGIRHVLYQLDFVYKKPEKVPHKVDEDVQKKFIKRYKAIRNRLKKGDGLYFMDVTHPEHTAIPGHGWIKRGETKFLKSNPRPYRLNIHGAINIRSLKMVVRFEKKINKDAAMDILEDLRKHQPKGWIYLICDNAGYYQSSEVKAYAKSLAIKLVYLPPYSPNLNLLERIWKFFKKKVLYNKHYREFIDMLNVSKKFFREIDQYREELQTLMVEKFQIIKS